MLFDIVQRSLQMSELNASILSYPHRGHWGDNTYRGNCSGHVIKDLLDTYHPDNFIEVFSGGGTGEDVAAEYGYKDSIHLDLNNGWDALKDDLPRSSDFIFSHPPYWSIIDYNKVRGEYTDTDLSCNSSYEEFIFKLDQVNEKIYNALTVGGRHAILIGDVRKKGHYYSLVKDMTWIGVLESHLIKQQFNTESSKYQYNGKFIPITHEHLLVFKKIGVWQVDVKWTRDVHYNLLEMNRVTWRALVQSAIQELGGQATLAQLYDILKGCKRAESVSDWKAKIRQTLRASGFKRVKKGTYTLDIS